MWQASQPSSHLIVEWHNTLYLPSEWERAFVAARTNVRLRGIPVFDALSGVGTDPHLAVLAYPAASHYMQEVTDAIAYVCEQQVEMPWLRVGIAACGDSEPPLSQSDVSKLVPTSKGGVRRYPERCREPADLRDEVELWLNLTAETVLHRGGPSSAQNYESETLIARESQVNKKGWMGWL